jgi:hypothetical protein
MSQNIDPRAPTQLTDCEIQDLKVDPLIVHLRKRRDAFFQAARRKYRTFRNAREAESVEYLLSNSRAQRRASCAQHSRKVDRQRYSTYRCQTHRTHAVVDEGLGGTAVESATKR